jgi:iron complex transport system substrate-binding protein
VNRRLLSLLATPLLLLLLVACGGDDDDDASAAAAADTRIVETAYGELEIPADPQRIVGDVVTVDYLQSLGFDTDRFVGVFDKTFFAENGDHYLAEVLGDDVADVGSTWEPNFEQIAALEPDLILLPFDQIDGHEGIEELRAIAPLAVVPTSEGGEDAAARFGGAASFQDWRSTLRAYGALLDKDREADEYIAESEAMLDEIRTEHADLIASITATEAKSTPDYMAINALSAAKESGVLGSILMSELGFVAPPQQEAVAPDEYGTIELSAENLDLVDGDLLFLEVRSGSTEHEESPLWPSLGVVQDDGVVVVGNHWEFGGSAAARLVMTEIGAALDGMAASQ